MTINDFLFTLVIIVHRNLPQIYQIYSTKTLNITIGVNHEAIITQYLAKISVNKQ